MRQIATSGRLTAPIRMPEICCLLGLMINATAYGQARIFNSEGTKPPAELAPYFTPPAPYRSDIGNFRSPLVFADGTRVQDPAEWPRRRDEILTTWHKIMGPWPPLIERPRVEVVEGIRREGIVQQQLRIEVALGGEMVDALLLLPEAPGPGRKRPAVLVVYYRVVVH